MSRLTHCMHSIDAEVMSGPQNGIGVLSAVDDYLSGFAGAPDKIGAIDALTDNLSILFDKHGMQ